MLESVSTFLGQTPLVHPTAGAYSVRKCAPPGSSTAQNPPVLEQCGGCIFHAAASVLQPLDHIQDSFLSAVGLRADEAFLDYNLAPLSLRRDIGMLGFIHKTVLGTARPEICELFPRELAKGTPYGTRLSSRRHTKQLIERCDGTQTLQFYRSAFGLVSIYNVLPQDVVDKPSASSFQSALTEAARDCCRGGGAWQSFYSTRGRLGTRPTFIPNIIRAL